MSDRNHHVCPVKRASSLDNRIRRWIQNPQKILSAYIKEGMTVLDVGCGPGFFSIDMAQMVGESGSVIAADLQEGMLEKLRAPNKMTLHSNGLFRLWTASGCIDHPQMACFAFLARHESARFRCNDSFF